MGPTTASWRRRRDTVAPNETRNLKHHDQDQQSDRDHENGNLSIGLGRKFGRQGRARTERQSRACGADTSQDRGKRDWALETFPSRRRRFMHGISVSHLTTNDEE